MRDSGKEPATQGDLQAVRTALKGDLIETRTKLTGEIQGARTELKTEIQDVRAELKTEIHGVRAELKTEIQGVRTELKAEIQGVRTELKAEIQGVRTEIKTEIQCVRTELKVVEHKLAVEIVKTNARMDRMERNLRAEMKAGFERVTQTLDKFWSKLETFARESLTLPRTLDEHGKRLADCEHRLAALESRP